MLKRSMRFFFIIVYAQAKFKNKTIANKIKVDLNQRRFKSMKNIIFSCFQHRTKLLTYIEQELEIKIQICDRILKLHQINN